jgi:hypothetical protein
MLGAQINSPGQSPAKSIFIQSILQRNGWQPPAN